MFNSKRMYFLIIAVLIVAILFLVSWKRPSSPLPTNKTLNDYTFVDSNNLIKLNPPAPPQNPEKETIFQQRNQANNDTVTQEKSQILKEDAGAQQSDDVVSSLIFEDSYGGIPQEGSRLDKDLVASGLAFRADFLALEKLNIGDKINVSMPYIGEGYEGVAKITKNELTPLSLSRSLVMDFKEPGTYMTAFYTNGLIKGNIYATSGAYTYEHDENHGYIISTLEYKRIKNALFID